MPDPDSQTVPSPGAATHGARPEDSALRREAEQIVQGTTVLSPETIKAMPPEAILQIFHELEVHRVELVMQNKELRAMQVQLDSEELRYGSLYDQAPTGYCTLNEQDLILEANRTAASLLGVAPGTLRRKLFTRFILKDDQDLYYLYRRQLHDPQKPQVCELRMQQADGTVFWAHLVSTAGTQYAGRFECRVAISDITTRKQGEERLRQNEQRRRLTLEAASAGTWEWDLQTNENTWSDELWPLYGLEPYSCEPSYARWLETVHPDDRAAIEQSLQQALLHDAALNIEWRVQHPDGTQRWLLSRGVPYQDGQDGGKRYLGIVLDVTDRKQTEAELLRTETALEEAQRLAEIGSWVWETKSNSLTWSEAVYRIFGRDPSLPPADYQAVQQYFTPESWARLSAAVAEGQTQGRPYACDVEVVKGDGSHCWITARGEALRDAEGTVWCLRGTIQDITERKRAEEALRESEERFRILHEAASGGIVIHDQGLILDCNQGLADQTGYAMEELINRDGVTLIAPAWRALVRQNIRSGYLQSYEVEGLRRDGTLYPLSIRGRAIPYKGRMVRITEFRDISEHKQAEAERVRLQAQLLQAQKMESVGRLAGGVAHDFNNMLSIILGVAEMAEEQVDESSQLYVFLQDIKMAAQRSAALTRQLLAFARKQIIAPQVLDINSTVEEALKILRRLIGEDIQLTWVPHAGLWPVKMDPAQVDQILANLCINARDAIAGNGKITIVTKNVSLDAATCAEHLDALAGDYVLMAVSDTGEGMDALTLQMIFEPFFTTKAIGGGTGLGLAMVYGIVKQNRGWIDVQSQPDQGTTFNLYLPRHGGTVTIDPGENSDVSLLHAHKTVLVVEDEEALLQLNTLILASLGYTVIAAAAPGEALRLAQEHPGAIDLLLTDVILPEMNGRDLATRLHQLYPEMRQIFTSGYTADIIARHGVLTAGVCFLQKPFSKRDLVVKINEVFAHKQPGPLENPQ